MEEFARLFDLSGKRALVIGAGSGIGAASAKGLAAFGAEVWCADINDEAIAKVAADISGARSFHFDVADPGASSNLLSTFGIPDIVVSTPAINVRKRITEVSDDEFDRVIEINLKGNFRVMRDFGRAMAANGGGSIIAFSSIRAQVVEPGQAVYAATKAGEG